MLENILITVIFLIVNTWFRKIFYYFSISRIVILGNFFYFFYNYSSCISTKRARCKFLSRKRLRVQSNRVLVSKKKGFYYLAVFFLNRPRPSRRKAIFFYTFLYELSPTPSSCVIHFVKLVKSNSGYETTDIGSTETICFFY